MRLSTFDFTKIPTELIDVLHRDRGFEGNTIIESTFVRSHEHGNFIAFEYSITMKWTDNGMTEAETLYVSVTAEGKIQADYDLASVHNSLRRK